MKGPGATLCTNDVSVRRTSIVVQRFYQSRWFLFWGKWLVFSRRVCSVRVWFWSKVEGSFCLHNSHLNSCLCFSCPLCFWFFCSVFFFFSSFLHFIKLVPTNTLIGSNVWNPLIQHRRTCCTSGQNRLCFGLKNRCFSMNISVLMGSFWCFIPPATFARKWLSSCYTMNKLWPFNLNFIS